MPWYNGDYPPSIKTLAGVSFPIIAAKQHDRFRKVRIFTGLPEHFQVFTFHGFDVYSRDILRNRPL